MKTIIGTLIALGLLSTAAAAQYCPPGYGYRAPAYSSYGHYRPTYGHGNVVIQEAPAVKVEPAPEAPAAPIEPAPVQPKEELPPK
jgi:hypothetical protein